MIRDPGRRNTKKTTCFPCSIAVQPWADGITGSAQTGMSGKQPEAFRNSAAYLAACSRSIS